MLTLYQPHDKLVKKMLENKRVAIDLIKNTLPTKTLKKLDLATLQLTTESAVSEAWKKYRNDIVFHCKTKKKKDTYIYILIEHQSTPDRFMPLRMQCYKYNLIGKYLHQKNPPKKIPNIIGIVLYHGETAYPYSTDVAACFEDRELALKDALEPMVLIDLKKISEKELFDNVGDDTLLKFLLKYSRTKDFIKKIRALMEQRPSIFVSLSTNQATFVFHYVLHVGKGTPSNAKMMKIAMNRIYGQPKADKIFSLADYFREEGMQEGIQKGREEGIQEGIQRGREEVIAKMVAKGKLTRKQAEEIILGA